MLVEKEINPRFEEFLFDWDHYTYLLVGGYGSSKSYHVAVKLVLKLLEEKRTALVVREVYETHRDSTYSLLNEVIESMGLGSHIKSKVSPLQINFPNGSKIIFRGVDNKEKLKSINDISIIWIEECSEVKYEGYKELIGRLRHPKLTLHMILSTNPVSKSNWVYKHFFIDKQNKRVTLDDKELYVEKTMVVNDVYYHHSTADDNMFLPRSYIKNLDDMAEYDPDLHRVARKGQFGTNGKLVLPNFKVMDHNQVLQEINRIDTPIYKNGMDFGFEISYNALIRMVVDHDKKILYIFWEYYTRGKTDDVIADDLIEAGLQKTVIKAENAEPKTIAYLQQRKLRVIPCTKLTRLENTKKMKRFKQIICSDRCENTISELEDLSYKLDKLGEIIEDEFEIDPHTFSAMWYGLDDYEVGSVKGMNKR